MVVVVVAGWEGEPGGREVIRDAGVCMEQGLKLEC